jgi:PAS domain S-box-containing protein
MADDSEEFGVLVVDDDEAMAELTATHLSRLLTEATVCTETDPTAVLDRLDSERVDCIVSDYDMPVWTGLDLLERVRAADPRMPFILFTGKGSEEIASEAISAGVTDYLQKRAGSDRYEVLANRVRNAVSRQWAVREAERLQQITDVIRTTQRELVGATTVTEICDGVCQSLTDAAAYEGAWLGEYDPETAAVTHHGSAGRGDTLRGATLDLTDDDWAFVADCVSGTETRVQTATVAAGGDTVTNADITATDGPGPSASVAATDWELLAVPLVHDDGVFGVLFVYAAADYEFGETEADVLIELSWTVAQAISATRTRQTLVERERTLTRYESILDVLADPVYALDAEGYLTYVNEAFETITGYDETELLGKHGSTLLAADDIAALQRDVESLLDDPSRTRTRREIDVHTADGRTVRCEDNITLLPDLGDGFRGTVGVVRDIEDRVETERNLRETKAKTEAIHGFAREIATCDSVDTVCQRAVAAADRILEFDICYVGLREGHRIVPKAVHGVDEPTPVPYDGSVAGNVMQAGEPRLTDRIVDEPAAALDDTEDERFESGITVPIGEFGVFQAASASPADFDDRDVELAELLLSHVTEALNRLEYETKLRDERDRVAALFENLPEPAAACHAGPEGPVVDDINTEFERVFGYAPEEIVGENIDDYVIPDGDDPITLEETLYVGKTIQTEVRRRTKHGVRDFHVTIIPVDLDGFSNDGYVIYNDISEQKHRERELSRQNDRLAEFTSLVTHDLRNPLNVAMGNLELAKELEDYSRIDTAQAALDRMEGLIGDFLSLAKQGRTVNDPTTMTLETVVRQAWRTVDTGPKATLDIVDNLGVVSADAERCRTVFENLFRNALEHGKEDVSLRVGRLPDGFYVEDDGPGIDAETREKVFEYGYSTERDGTGFGLAIVERVVHAHGWEITATEAESGGARFEIRTE